MSRAFRTLVVLTLLGPGAAAQESSDWFISMGGGFVGITDATGTPGGTTSFDGGYSLNVGIGKHLWRKEAFVFDVQGEVLFNSFQIGDIGGSPPSVSDKSENISWMLSGIGNWYLSPQFAVYAGLGVGYTSSLEIDEFDNGGQTLLDDSVVAGQVKLGVKYHLGGNLDMRMGYRYFKMDTAEISDLAGPPAEFDIDQHIVEVVMEWGL